MQNCNIQKPLKRHCHKVIYDTLCIFLCASSCVILCCSFQRWPQIARFTWPTLGPPVSCWPQVGPMLAPWTLLSGAFLAESVFNTPPFYRLRLQHARTSQMDYTCMTFYVRKQKKQLMIFIFIYSLFITHTFLKIQNFIYDMILLKLFIHTQLYVVFHIVTELIHLRRYI